MPRIPSTSVTTTYDIAYGAAFRQRVDLIVPNGTIRGVIFWFHGGGWSGGSKSTSGYTVGSPAHTTNDESLANNISLGGYVVINCNVRLTSGPADGWNGNYDGVYPNNITDVETIFEYSTVSGAGSLFSPHWATIYNYVNTHGWIAAGVSSGGHIAVMGVGNYGTATGRWPRAVISMGAPMDLYTNPPHTDAVDNPVNPLFESTLLDVYTPEPTVDRKSASPRWSYGTNYQQGPWYNALNASGTRFYFYQNSRDNLVVESMVTAFARALPYSQSYYVRITEGTVIAGQFDHWFTTPLWTPVRQIANYEFDSTTYRITSGLIRPSTGNIAIFGDSVSTYGGLEFLGGDPTNPANYVAANFAGNIVSCFQDLYPNYTVTNVSRGGVTTHEALTGTNLTGSPQTNPFAPWPNITEYLTNQRPDIVVLRYGLADSVLMTSAAASLDNLEVIVNHAQALGSQVILIGVNPAAVITDPAHCGYVDSYSSAADSRASAINTGILSLAQTRNLLVANPRQLTKPTCSFPDGLHPNWQFGSVIVDEIARQLRGQIPVTESSNMRFLIRTIDVADNTVLDFEIVPTQGNITVSDFASTNRPLTNQTGAAPVGAYGVQGNVTIVSNNAVVTVGMASDLVAEDLESFRFRLRMTPRVENFVSVADTSAATAVYALAATPSTVGEAQTVRITLTTSLVPAGTMVPYLITGVTASDVTVPGVLSGNFVVPEPLVPRRTNLGPVGGWRTDMLAVDGIFYRDRYVIISDEPYWNTSQPTGQRLKEKAQRYRRDRPGVELGVVVTPYTFSPLLLIPETTVLDDITAAGCDFVALDPYYFADGTWTTAGLLSWTVNFRNQALARGLNVFVVIQGFARIGSVTATTAYNNQLLALTGIDEFVVFGLEDGPDLNPAIYTSLNNDFAALTMTSNVDITLSADLALEGTETLQLALTGPGRTETVTVTVADTSVPATTTTTVAPTYAMTLASNAIDEGTATTLTFVTNTALGQPIDLAASASDVVAFSPVSFTPVYDNDTGTYRYTVTVTGLNVTSNRTVIIRAYRASVEVAFVTLIVQVVVAPGLGGATVLGGNLGSVLRGSYFSTQLNIPGAVSYAITSGSLPTGLTMTSSGTISGLADISRYSSQQSAYAYEFAVTTTPATPGNPYVFGITVIANQAFISTMITGSTEQPQNTGYRFRIPPRDEIDQASATSWVLVSGQLPPSSTLTGTGLLTVDHAEPILPLLRDNLVIPTAPNLPQLTPAGFERAMKREFADLQTKDYEFRVALTNGIDPVITAHTFRIIHFRISAQNPSSWFSQNAAYIDYDASQWYYVVFSNINEVINWNTASYLGDMANGTVSEFAVTAAHSAGSALAYTVTTPFENHMPQGMQLLSTGELSGRISFRCNEDDPANLPPGNIYAFSVRAYTDQHYSYAEQLFTIRVVRINDAPSDNIWIRSFPKLEQRQRLDNLLTDQQLFPSELLYKANDPWWGLAESLRFLFAPGLNPTQPAEYDTVLLNNHYNKKLLFDQLRTAVSVDYNLNVKYEVVYLTVRDDLLGVDAVTKQPRGLPMTIDLRGLIENYYQSSGQVYYTLKPNGLENMREQLRQYVGYYNPGLVPTWMSSVQPIPDQPGIFRAPIGFIPAVVLAYTVPGGSRIIAQRCGSINWNLLEFEFDRYQLENRLSANYNTTTMSYVPGTVVTFDNGTTVFDMDTTRVTDHMEYAADPEQGDKYLKFPTRGAYI